MLVLLSVLHQDIKVPAMWSRGGGPRWSSPIGATAERVL
jgi:hypothetical protein